MPLLSPQSFQNQLESGDFSNGTHTSQQVVQINFCSALQSWLFFKWRPGKRPMLKSTECLLQGTKCLECPLQWELRAASSSKETLKCFATLRYRYAGPWTPFSFPFFFLFYIFYFLLTLTRSVWCCFHLCSSEVKTAMEACPYTALCHRNPLVLF